MSKTGDQISATLEGEIALAEKLAEIAAEAGAGSVGKAMRQATRSAAKEIILPAVKDLIPVDSGDLEDALTVRAVKFRRGSGNMGHYVGFPDPLFQGDTFYGGFIEYGFENRAGYDTPADSYLRRPLYDRELEVRAHVSNHLRTFVRGTNRAVPDRA